MKIRTSALSASPRRGRVTLVDGRVVSTSVRSASGKSATNAHRDRKQRLDKAFGAPPPVDEGKSKADNKLPRQKTAEERLATRRMRAQRRAA